MKQKKGNVSLKSPFNGVKKADTSIAKGTPSKINQKKTGNSPAKGTPAKINQKKNGISPAKGTPAKVNGKKTGKTPVKVVPPKKLEEEEEDDSSEEEDSGADVAAGVADDAEDSAAEEQEDGDEVDDDDDDEDADDGVDDEDEDEDEDDGVDDEDDDEDDEAEDGDLLDNEAEEEGEDESEDEEPVEAPIEKKSSELPVKAKKAKSPKESAFSKINTGALPKDFPKDQVLVVKNLPKNYKQIDLVEVFAKYGNLHTIYNNHGPVSSIAYVAYSSPEEAEAAQAGTDNIAKVKGVTIKVNIQTPNPKKVKKVENKEEKKLAYEDRKRKIEESKSRTVFIKNIKPNTNEDQVKEHFAECGEIESVSIIVRHQNAYGFVCFKDASSVPAAVNLHNSVFNGLNMWVHKGDEQNRDVTKDPQRTILLKNSQNLECIEIDKLDSIFSKCGEIEGYSILCRKNVLAFITFADQKGAKKALQMNGSTVNGLDIEIEEYKTFGPKKKLMVFIQNVKPGTTEDEIREHFASTGPIESVHLWEGFSTVKFEDVDSFCKAFLQNETYLNGQVIFVEPYSEKKQAILRNSNHPKSSFNRKRPAPFNKGGYAKKRRDN